MEQASIKIFPLRTEVRRRQDGEFGGTGGLRTNPVQGQKERPIIFGATMVRAILDDRKSQTRRIAWCGEYPEEGSVEIDCPYGVAGDRLWVRETFALHDHRDPPIVYYRVDDQNKYESDGAWKPSIHMPRWASRITLEITKVRVERLQDISEEDAKAEGIEPERFYSGKIARRASVYRGEYYRTPFRYLWEEINDRDAWDKNPWVWVISFCRVDSTKPANAFL